MLSQCFNGSYPGDYSAIAKRIETFFWRLEQKALYGGMREFCETALANVLFKVFEKTRITRRIQPVEGPEQLGKTRAATEYTRRNNSGRTIYTKIAGGSHQGGVGEFIWNLAERLDLPYTIKLKEKRIRIKQHLESCDLIIIDEAHLIFTWSDRAQAEFWDYLRTDIFDDGARGVVLIFTNNSMFDSLSKFRARTKYNVGQLLGRMRVDAMRIDPAEDIIEDDVEMLVTRYLKNPKKDTIRKLHALASRNQLGHFGLLDDVLNESWTRAKARKAALSDEIILNTANETLSTLNARKELY
jgi:DNA transposition AAA+ family ATPase